MEDLSRISGGKALSLSQTSGAQLASVLESPTPADIEYRHTPLWDKWWWLSAILLLLTVEWSIRRLTGIGLTGPPSPQPRCVGGYDVSPGLSSSSPALFLPTHSPSYFMAFIDICCQRPILDWKKSEKPL